MRTFRAAQRDTGPRALVTRSADIAGLLRDGELVLRGVP